MKQLKCIVIDDEDIDRLMVISMVNRSVHLELLAAYASAEECMASEICLQADVLFLDIDMEGVSGLEFRKMAAVVPACIFITSHPEYAVDSYALDTLDYIMKPLTPQRFQSTEARIVDLFDIRSKAAMYDSSFSGGHIFIKEGSVETKIMLHEILYLEALKDYTRIITREKKHYVLASIGNLLKQAEFASFLRIHRSFAVRKDVVMSFTHKFVTLQHDIELPVGRNYKDGLRSILPDI